MIEPGRGISAARLEDLIEHAAVRLRPQGEEGVSLLVRTDHATQLRVDVRLDGMTVVASLQVVSGDGARLGAEMGELQERLQRQGIRLETAAGQFTGAGTDGGGHPHRRLAPPLDLPDHVRMTGLAAPRRGLATSHPSSRGQTWEFWA